MKTVDALMIGAVSLIIIVTSGGEASAQGEGQDSNRKKARWDRVKMVVDVGGIALGAATWNPALVGASSGALIRNTYQLGKHSAGGRGNPTTATMTAPTSLVQPESLVAVPGRTGYFYYPSNPNQLYFDANAVARIRVRIVNPAKNGRAVRYSVSGTEYEVPPGYTQVLDAPAGSILSHDRGDEVGTEMFTLTDGTYEFRTVEQGWRFYASNPNTATVARAKSDARPSGAGKPAVTLR